MASTPATRSRPICQRTGAQPPLPRTRRAVTNLSVVSAPGETPAASGVRTRILSPCSHLSGDRISGREAVRRKNDLREICLAVEFFLAASETVSFGGRGQGSTVHCCRRRADVASVGEFLGLHGICYRTEEKVHLLLTLVGRSAFCLMLDAFFMRRVLGIWSSPWG